MRIYRPDPNTWSPYLGPGEMGPPKYEEPCFEYSMSCCGFEIDENDVDFARDGTPLPMECPRCEETAPQAVMKDERTPEMDD